MQPYRHLDFPFAYPQELFRPVYQSWDSAVGNQFAQLPQSNLVVNPVPDYITLSSADRDRKKYPSTSEYTIKLIDDAPGQPNGVPGVQYKNVESVKLLSAAVPNTNNVMDEPYLLLEIKELTGNYDSASRVCQDAFTKLIFQRVTLSDFLRLDKGVGDPLTRVFWPTPLACIDRLSLAFRTYDGELFDFGTDDGPQPDPKLQTSVTLEIRTVVPNVKAALGNRNV